MGYLVRSAGIPNFNKAVISLWFRVPAATLAAVSALTDSPGGLASDGWNGAGFSPPLYKTIPLITFGSMETGMGDFAGVPVQPSFIGVDCSFVADGHPPRLVVNLQTANVCSFSKAPQHPEFETRPECFFMGGVNLLPTDWPTLTVTGDVWHHALISFDISPACSITYANAFRSPPDDPFALSLGPTFSWAFDDVNMVGKSMSPSGSGGNNWSLGAAGSTLTDQHILPQGLFDTWTAQDIAAFPLEDSTDFVVSVASSSIASSGNPIGIPTSAAFVDSVYNVEMAYLQIFTGVTLDASVTENRRAFVKSDGTPETDYSIAAALLGKSPEIRLSSGRNWKAGTNTGSLGGTFTKTGTINLYTPGPGL